MGRSGNREQDYQIVRRDRLCTELYFWVYALKLIKTPLIVPFM